tara:strand:+ start:235 stop:507 length:273 start_codon:yes stop_codon:yes gene_type:complete
MRVQNFKSNNGNYVPNQFIINDDKNNLEYFQSYETIIAKIDWLNNKIYLDENYWNYSRTTSVYRNKFLGIKIKEIKSKIKNNEIQLINLN